MKIPNNNTPCYPLTTMQQTDLHGKMFRFNVGTYVCLSFTLNFKLEFSIMERAIALEYERNDCLRQRFFKAGRTWKQFFLKQCVSPKVEYIDFRKSAKISQHDFFERESARFIPFDANMLSKFILYTTREGKDGIYLKICHLSVDGMGAKNVIQDIFDVYFALLNNDTLPPSPSSTENCIQVALQRSTNPETLKENEDFFAAHFAKDGEPLFNSVFGSDIYNVAPKRYLQMGLANLLFSHGSSKLFHIDSDLCKQMRTFCQYQDVSVQSLFILGLWTHISKVNDKNNDISISNMCHNRNTIEEKRSGGSLYSGAVVRAIIPLNASFLEALDVIEEAQYDNLRHPDFTLSHWSELVKLKFNSALGAMYYGVSLSFFDEAVLRLPLDYTAEYGYHINGSWISGIVAIVCSLSQDGGFDVNVVFNDKKYARSCIDKMISNIALAMRIGMNEPNSSISTILDQM